MDACHMPYAYGMECIGKFRCENSQQAKRPRMIPRPLA